MHQAKKPTLLYFNYSPNDEHLTTMSKLAENFKADFFFAKVSLKKELGRKMAEAFGLRDSFGIRLMSLKNNQMQKYKPTSASYEDIAKLLQDYNNGKAKLYLKTEPIPKNNDDSVKIVVGASFSDFVIKSQKHVLLEIYAPWCGHCQRLAPIY